MVTHEKLPNFISRDEILCVFFFYFFSSLFASSFSLSSKKKKKIAGSFDTASVKIQYYFVCVATQYRRNFFKIKLKINKIDWCVLFRHSNCPGAKQENHVAAF